MIEARGWHSRGYLPHFDSPETVQFVTFRLADSLPSFVVERIRMEKLAIRQADHELDLGRGACWLKRPDIARLVEDALLYFDSQRYRLLAWCLMPNHVHVLFELFEGCSLTSIVWSWKSFTSKKANALLGRSGPFWHTDYFDRFMRNEQHFVRTLDYIEQNPVAAGLAKTAGDWPWGSARFRAQSKRAGGPRSE